MVLIILVIAIWWIVVVQTESAIFPTPWQVVAGAFELAQDGTLWEHIGASLFRVGTGFGLALLVAIPLGLWMGWVGGAYRTLNPIFQMLRPISPIAWIPLAILWFGVGDVSPIFPDLHLICVPDDRADHVGRPHDRATLPARSRKLRRLAFGAVPSGRDSRGAA
jgi:ABC-type nitrate/sulfonate/bicarbonate transport system permease component